MAIDTNELLKLLTAFVTLTTAVVSLIAAIVSITRRSLFRTVSETAMSRTIATGARNDSAKSNGTGSPANPWTCL